MRLATPARLRAAGFFLLEAVSFGLVVYRAVAKDESARRALQNFMRKARSL